MISSREQIIEKLKKDYPFLSSKYGLKKIGLFGSFASESQNENSDVDLIVEFKRHWIKWYPRKKLCVNMIKLFIY